MKNLEIQQSLPDPDDTIESVFGNYTQEEIDAAYDEYDKDQSNTPQGASND